MLEVLRASSGVGLDIALAGLPFEETAVARSSVFAFPNPGRVPEGAMSPIELAAQLEHDCATAMEGVAELRGRGGVSPTFACELTDIEVWCAYGNYFAGKLRAGVALATARAEQDLKQQQRAVAELEKALVHWKRLAELGAKFNQLPVLSNSKEPFSWSALTPAVERDIEIAKAPLTSTNSTR